MSSKRTIDLRKKKPGIYRELFSFPSSPGKPRFSGGRKSPLRTKRRRTRALVALGVLILGAGATWGVGYATYLPQFSINHIEVVGADGISPDIIRTYVETQLFDGSHPFFSRENLFLYPRRSLEEGIQKYFPRIHSVNISRKSFLAQAIQVTIEERGPRARWCASDSCYLMDDSGFIFAEEATSSPSTVPYTLRGALSTSSSPVGQKFLLEHLTDVLTLLERLERAGFAPKGASVKSEPDFSVILEGGFELRAAFEEDPEKIVRNLELVLSSDALRGREDELEYVDLRFGNRVYYKFEGGEEQFQ